MVHAKIEMGVDSPESGRDLSKGAAKLGLEPSSPDSFYSLSVIGNLPVDCIYRCDLKSFCQKEIHKAPAAPLKMLLTCR